jgi:hypothetical protein
MAKPNEIIVASAKALGMGLSFDPDNATYTLTKGGRKVSAGYPDTITLAFLNGYMEAKSEYGN